MSNYVQRRFVDVVVGLSNNNVVIATRDNGPCDLTSCHTIANDDSWQQQVLGRGEKWRKRKQLEE
jgi:hypothetical protein